jgi:hypothetical protein
MAHNNFDRNVIFDEIRTLESDLTKAFVPGSYEWARENRPELISEIKKTESFIDNNYVAMNIGAVRNAINRYKKLHEALFQQFERQLSLFGDAAHH